MRRVLALLLLVFLASSADAYQVNVGINFKTSTPPPAGSVPWSTLGIVADSTTDNTAALNALPVNNPIFGDCPAGGTIVFAGQWLWQSSMQLYMKAGCRLTTTFANGIPGNASVTQASLNSPLTNVLVDGLYLQRIDTINSATTNRSYLLYINHFSMTNFTVSGYHQGFYIQGSDQVLGPGFMTGSCTAPGCDGIRQIGNVPKVPTTSGRPANVWLHNLVVAAGDAPLQTCQPTKSGFGLNVSTDDVLVENSYGSSTASSVILVGEDVLGSGQANVTCTNIAYRNITGIGSAFSIKVASSIPPMIVQTVNISNSTLDISVGGTTPAAAQILNAQGGVLDSVTMTGVTLLDTAERALLVQGATNTTFTGGSISAPSAGGLATVQLNADTNTTISNSTISAHLGAAVLVGVAGTTSTNATISGNTLNNVSTNQQGIFLNNVNGASVTGNTMLRQSTATGTIGIQYTNASGASDPGTLGAVSTGNDVSNMNKTPKIIFTCNGGTTNAATGNTGATDSTCP